MSTKLQRLLLGCMTAVAGLYIDIRFVGSELATSQMVFYSGVVLGLLGIQAGKTLMRPRQAAVAAGLVVLHFIALMRCAGCFRMGKTPVLIVVASAEVLVLTFLYTRIGQTVDPSGPFGLTPAEVEKRRVIKERLKSTL